MRSADRWTDAGVTWGLLHERQSCSRSASREAVLVTCAPLCHRAGSTTGGRCLLSRQRAGGYEAEVTTIESTTLVVAEMYEATVGR
jgi:hypothetical protein